MFQSFYLMLLSFETMPKLFKASAALIFSSFYPTMHSPPINGSPVTASDLHKLADLGSDFSLLFT